MKGTKNYYGGEDNQYEVIKIIEHFELDFKTGNILKYLLRAGKKDPSTRLEDLNKGLYYFQRLVDSEAKKQPIEVTLNINDQLTPKIEEVKEKIKKSFQLIIGSYIKSKVELLSESENLYSLRKGNEYMIKSVDDKNLIITTENGKSRSFLLSDLNLYFYSIEDKYPKQIKSLIVGDEIKAIDECLLDLDNKNALIVGKYYKIKRHGGDEIEIKSEVHDKHSFSLLELDQFFHVTHSDDTPKIIEELKVGDKIKAINPCLMGGNANEPTLTIGKNYEIQSINDGWIKILDDRNKGDHWFMVKELNEFFHITHKDQGVLTEENKRKIEQDDTYREGLGKPYH